MDILTGEFFDEVVFPNLLTGFRIETGDDEIGARREDTAIYDRGGRARTIAALILAFSGVCSAAAMLEKIGHTKRLSPKFLAGFSVEREADFLFRTTDFAEGHRRGDAVADREGAETAWRRVLPQLARSAR